MDILFYSLLLFLGTLLGSSLTLIFRKFPLGIGVSLSFSGSVMLVASFTSLIIPGMELGGFLLSALGISLGFAFMALIENLSPHEHVLKGYEGRIGALRTRRLALIVIGVTIHNIPEGLSVGSATLYSEEEGLKLALAIALQDIPEGLVVSLPMLAITGRTLIPVLMGVLSGGIESFFCLLGFYLLDLARVLLPLGLSFAGGAMIYVTVKEVFPEAFSEGKDFQVTLSFLTGFLLMLLLESII
ncbi:ZIP family zinc transporter [Hydrogenivirga caldilitoris]|uniref:ZIP family zinc transporter n=1 Tax=Hydrogenivirga caldilitoris TaxID=246264 RepID=A0A497XST9_9AQUI|nr:ZIP family metal transporter [Hydrogenivirga caldilitoris]RLJ71230.1 ZIP family zinc transporter [Hydrogenivirga caldilitoris]